MKSVDDSRTNIWQASSECTDINYPPSVFDPEEASAETSFRSCLMQAPHQLLASLNGCHQSVQMLQVRSFLCHIHEDAHTSSAATAAQTTLAHVFSHTYIHTHTQLISSTTERFFVVNLLQPGLQILQMPDQPAPGVSCLTASREDFVFLCQKVTASLHTDLCIQKACVHTLFIVWLLERTRCLLPGR